MLETNELKLSKASMIEFVQDNLHDIFADADEYDIENVNWNGGTRTFDITITKITKGQDG